MGKNQGRLCFLYQIDFSEGDELEFNCSIPEQRISGIVSNEDEFNNAVDSILSLFKVDRIEVALKYFRLREKRISGICPKSFPRTPLTTHLLSILSICLGGESKSELIHLPYPGTIMDQPNLFIHAYTIYSEEIGKWIKEQIHKPKK